MIKRHEFQQVLEDARLDGFDVLLVDHTSRFGRNQAECIRYKEELQRLGKAVVFVSQGIISGSDRDFLAERINETLDEAYSRNLSRYVRAGKAEMAAQGHALGHAPLGYRHNKAPSGRGAHAVPDDGTMPVLLALLRGYAGGQHSFKSLAQDLNAQGFRSTRGNPFTEGSIATVLSNPFYDGKFRYHFNRPDEEMREGVHEVPEEVRTLWRVCQEMRRARHHEGTPSPRSRNLRVYVLTGVLVCDTCGRPYHGVTNRSKNGTLLPRMFHNGHRCRTTPLSVGAARVEQEFADRVIPHIALDDRWREAVLTGLAQKNPQPDHSSEVKRLETALANLRKQHLWGAMTDEDFRSEFRQIECQLRALSTPQPDVLTPNLDRAAAILRDLPVLWHHPGVTLQQRRDLAGEVFEEIRLRGQTLVAVKPRPHHAPLFAYSIWRQQQVFGGTSLF